MRTLASLSLCAIGLAACTPAFGANEVGQKLFSERCVVCHQENAQGAAGVAPSLAGTLSGYLANADGRRFLSQILVSGMIGPIDTQGHKFNGMMPSFRADLSDAEMAAVINYVLGAFNGVSDADAAKPIAPQDVTAASAADPAPTGTRALRQSIKSAP